MSNNNNKALSAGIGYTIGNILVKGINFLMLPIFSRMLTTEEFGIYNLFLSYDAILFVVIGMALHSSIKSANYHFPNEINQYTSSVSIIYVINTIIMLIINTIFGKCISSALSIDSTVVYLLVLFSFGNALLCLYNTRISLDYAYKKYLLIALMNSLGNVGISLLLILTVFSDDKALGRITGVVVTIFVIALMLLASLYRKARPKFEKRYWKFGIKYSLPIIPHGISQVLLSQFDRIMIAKMVNKSAAGLYSLAGNIKLILTIISDSISNVWSTWFFAEIEKGNAKKIQIRARQLCCLYCIMIVGMMAISPELIYLLGGSKYNQAKYVAIPMILDAFILFVYNIVVVAEYYTKKTVYIMMGTLASAIINVILNYYFIMRYGFVAAAYTTLFAYICYLIFHLVISYRMIHFHVLPLKYLTIYAIIVALLSVLDLMFMKHIVMRYLIAFIVVGIMGIVWLVDLKKTNKEMT